MVKTAAGVLWDAMQGMFEDDAFPLAGALAYYSLLSTAPLLLVAVALAGIFFADGQVHTQLIEQMRRLVGEEGAALTSTVIANTGSEERSAWSLGLGSLLTLLGASTVFAQLQYALNRVWRVKAAPRAELIMNFLKHRILSFVHARDRAHRDDVQYLPDAEIEWRDTWLGALITAALFIAGKHVIGLYLGQTTLASSFGAAASVVIFMLWVYYAALILLFGAEITQAVAPRPVSHSKLKMSSLAGRSIPAS